MADEKPMGMYSAGAAERFGTVMWLDAAGKEHEITAYIPPSEYKWKDGRVVAEVVKFSRMGSPGSDPFQDALRGLRDRS